MYTNSHSSCLSQKSSKVELHIVGGRRKKGEKKSRNISLRWCYFCSELSRKQRAFRAVNKRNTRVILTRHAVWNCLKNVKSGGQLQTMPFMDSRSKTPSIFTSCIELVKPAGFFGFKKSTKETLCCIAIVQCACKKRKRESKVIPAIPQQGSLEKRKRK